MAGKLSLDRLLLAPPTLATLSHAEHGLSVTRETFLLPDKWMLHFYDYHGLLAIGGSTFQLHPGSASLAPANTPVQFTYRGTSRHFYAHFHMPGAENAPGFFWHSDPRVAALRALLEDAPPFLETDPRRASARLWEVLLGLATLKRLPESRSTEDRALETALRHIESELGGPMRISALARRIGMTPNSLARLFKNRLGQTPAAYLRKRRVNRALDLLRHSDLPVKAVACTVGFPDLQHFNKILRRETGKNPRAWRRDATG